MVDFEKHLKENTTQEPTDPLPWEADEDVLFIEEEPRERTLEELGLSDNPPEWDPSKDQTRAMEDIKDWVGSAQADSLHTLGGIAGSGKSTLVGKLAYDLLRGGKRVSFVSPTGKAALVLNESLTASGILHSGAGTVHSLIYTPDVCPKTGKVLGWVKRHEIDADLIVVDEASMVNRKMYQDLESFGVPILAVGDHKQLPPVGEPPFLMKDPISRLDKIHRQAKGNPIIRLATWARNGADDATLIAGAETWGGDSVFVAKNDKEAREFGKPPGFCISYTNNLRTAINAAVRLDLYGYDDEDDPQAGETVICLKNHRLPEGIMIPNGVRGTVISCNNTTSYYEMVIDFGSYLGTHTIYANKHQFLRDKTFKGFDEVPGEHRSWYSVGALLDFGYGISGHKSVVSDTLLYPVGQSPKKISEFKSGDKILGVNEQGEVIETEVVDLHDHGTLEAYEICFDDGYTISCSKDHKFLTEHGQVPIEAIVREGLEVLCASGKERVVSSMQKEGVSKQEGYGEAQKGVQEMQGVLSCGDEKEKDHREISPLWKDIPNQESKCSSSYMRGMPKSSRPQAEECGLGHTLWDCSSEIHATTGAPQDVCKVHRDPNKDKNEAGGGPEYLQQNSRGEDDSNRRYSPIIRRPRDREGMAREKIREFESLAQRKPGIITATGSEVLRADTYLAKGLSRARAGESEESYRRATKVGAGEPGKGRGEAHKSKGEGTLCSSSEEMARRKPGEVQRDLDENDCYRYQTISDGGVAAEQWHLDLAGSAGSVRRQAKTGGLRFRKRLGRSRWVLALLCSQGYRERLRKVNLYTKQRCYAEERGTEKRGVLDQVGHELLLAERKASARLGSVAYSHAPLSSTGGLVRRKVVRIRYLGPRRMYDLEVSHPKHNFLLPNGIVTSNSQGSQANDVSVFLETWLLKKVGEDDAARWRYTSFTRAVNRLMLRLN